MNNFDYWKPLFDAIPNTRAKLTKNENNNIFNITYSFGDFGKLKFVVNSEEIEQLYKQLSDNSKFWHRLILGCRVGCSSDIDYIRDTFYNLYSDYSETGDFRKIAEYIKNYECSYNISTAKSLSYAQIFSLNDYCYPMQCEKINNFVTKLEEYLPSKSDGTLVYRINKNWLYSYETEFNRSGPKGNRIVTGYLTLCPADPIENEIIKRYDEYCEQMKYYFRELERKNEYKTIEECKCKRLSDIIRAVNRRINNRAFSRGVIYD